MLQGHCSLLESRAWLHAAWRHGRAGNMPEHVISFSNLFIEFCAVKTVTTGVSTHLQRAAPTVAQMAALAARQMEVMEMVPVPSAPAQQAQVVPAAAVEAKISPYMMKSSCIQPLQRPPRPLSPLSVLPSLRSPAFFLLLNWWVIPAVSIRNLQLRPRDQVVGVAILILRSFAQPRLPLRPPRPSAFHPMEAVHRAGSVAHPRALVNALPKRRSQKTIDNIKKNSKSPKKK